MPYAEAIARYGSDKPDLRCGLEIDDLSDVFRDSEFRVFKQIVADGGVVRGFAVPGGNSYTRNQLDALVDQAKQMGFTGLIWVRPGEPPLSSVKALGEAALGPALERAGASSDDLLLIAAGPAGRDVEAARAAAAGDREEGEPAEPRRVRVPLGHRLPAPRVSRGEGAGIAMHHPFTSPMDEDVDRLEIDPGRGAREGVRPRAERDPRSAAAASESTTRRCRRGFSGGSGISDEDAQQPVRLLSRRARYGTPPHGGIALGLDRIVAILAGERRSARSSRFRRPRTRSTSWRARRRGVDQRKQLASSI